MNVHSRPSLKVVMRHVSVCLLNVVYDVNMFLTPLCVCVQNASHFGL